MADVPLPTPSCEQALRLVPLRHRDDAIQEAWVAHLEKRDPVQAINTYVVRELRYEEMHVTLTDLKAAGNPT